MIQLFQNNSHALVEQNGYLSDTIELSRGCRQDDSLSPYVFVLCAEILSHALRECRDFRGIKVHGEETKVSQYAEDTTLFVAEDLESVITIVNYFKWFKSVSDLDINNNKTK